MNFIHIKETAARVYSKPECSVAELSNGEMICASSKPESGSLGDYTPEQFVW